MILEEVVSEVHSEDHLLDLDHHPLYHPTLVLEAHHLDLEVLRLVLEALLAQQFMKNNVTQSMNNNAPQLMNSNVTHTTGKSVTLSMNNSALLLMNRNVQLSMNNSATQYMILSMNNNVQLSMNKSAIQSMSKFATQ